MGSTGNIGFDLDLTLVDTRRAMEAAAARINDILGVCVDQRAFVSSTGPAHLAATKRVGAGASVG